MIKLFYLEGKCYNEIVEITGLGMEPCTQFYSKWQTKFEVVYGKEVGTQ
jgi:hypothetical protein